MTNALYNTLKTALMKAGVNLATDTIKVALIKSTYTPNIDTDTFFGDINSNEVPATGGYTAGGVTLTSPTVTEDTANDRAVFDAADSQWPSSTITARYAALYKSTGNNATSQLIGYITFLDAGGSPADKSTNGDTFYIQWNAVGIILLT